MITDIPRTSMTVVYVGERLGDFNRNEHSYRPASSAVILAKTRVPLENMICLSFVGKW